MLVAPAPNITDWMQGLGSLAAVLTSTVAIVLTGLLLRHEVRARRAESEAAASAQARLIVVTRRGPRIKSGDRSAPFELVVTNFSQAPVHNLELRPRIVSRRRIIPTDNGDLGLRIDHLRPGASVSRKYTAVSTTTGGLFSTMEEGEITGSAEFTDSAGIRWRSRLGGKLTVVGFAAPAPPSTVASALSIVLSVGPTPRLRSAISHRRNDLRHRLARYAEQRNRANERAELQRILGHFNKLLRDSSQPLQGQPGERLGIGSDDE